MIPLGEFPIDAGEARFERRGASVTLYINGVPSSQWSEADPADLEFEYMRWMLSAVRCAFPPGAPLRAHASPNVLAAQATSSALTGPNSLKLVQQQGEAALPLGPGDRRTDEAGHRFRSALLHGAPNRIDLLVRKADGDLHGHTTSMPRQHARRARPWSVDSQGCGIEREVWRASQR
ncbi:MAG: hypothetical protein LBL01_02035, partial [Bifidobacteriaceae bacterium]|nr:hypothetical protein [Bifidobacteriaceae bacterium]